MNHSPTISIIIPACNVDQYIEKCVNSILGQTYVDYEVLLVDDGSVDSTAELCDRLALRDPRILTFHKENGGLSDARNYGLSRASGEYITFVDGDDYVPPEYLGYLYRLLTENDADISMVDGERVQEGSVPDGSAVAVREKITAKEAVRRMLLRQGASHTSWGKLFKASLWSKVRFPVGLNYEDYATTYRVYAEAETVGFSDIRLYYYVQHADSIMHAAVSEKTLLVLDVSDEVSRYLLEKWPENRDAVTDLQMATYLKSLQGILNVGIHAYPEQQKRISRFVRKNAAVVLKADCTPRNDRIKVLAFFLGKRIFLSIYNRFDGA